MQTLEFELTREDWRAYLSYSAPRWWNISGGWVVVVTLFIGGSVGVFEASTDIHVDRYLFVALLLGLVALLSKARELIKRRIRLARWSPPAGPTRLTVSDAGVAVAQADAHRAVAWDLVHEVVVQDGFLLLATNDEEDKILIPMRAFADRDAMLRFAAACDAWIKADEQRRERGAGADDEETSDPLPDHPHIADIALKGDDWPAVNADLNRNKKTLTFAQSAAANHLDWWRDLRRPLGDLHEPRRTPARLGDLCGLWLARRRCDGLDRRPRLRQGSAQAARRQCGAQFELPDHARRGRRHPARSGRAGPSRLVGDHAAGAEGREHPVRNAVERNVHRAQTLLCAGRALLELPFRRPLLAKRGATGGRRRNRSPTPPLAPATPSAAEPSKTDVRTLDVGAPDAGRAQPDEMIFIDRDGEPFLRVNLFYPPQDYHSRTGVEIWRDWLVVGFGARVALVSLSGDARRVLALSETEPPDSLDYFCQIEATAAHLFVTSGRRVFRLGEDGEMLWKSAEVGLDGVLVWSDDEAGIVHGSGEWDPPGGWRDFRLAIETGLQIP